MTPALENQISRSENDFEIVNPNANPMLRREEVKLRPACEDLRSLIDARVIAFDCATMSFEASRKTDEQTEALRINRSKLLSNKGFLMVLILSACRYMYHFLTFTRARDACSACYESASTRQDIKKCPVSRAFL